MRPLQFSSLIPPIALPAPLEAMCLDAYRRARGYRPPRIPAVTLAVLTVAMGTFTTAWMGAMISALVMLNAA